MMRVLAKLQAPAKFRMNPSVRHSRNMKSCRMLPAFSREQESRPAWGGADGKEDPNLFFRRRHFYTPEFCAFHGLEVLF